ncbi:MAG: dicarboxylate/amino acid:cation symporter [Synergistaceae bacterium]|nr:dicarboxylate/amino acid:cation symporter [Synergistaceae bacterium]
MQKFPIDPENTQDAVKSVLEYVNDRLKSYRLKHKDELKSSLMAEESLLRLMEYSDFSKVSAIFVKVMRIFGNVKIILRVPGEKFNFAETLGIDTALADDSMPETQEAIQNIIMRSFEDKLTYSHKNGLNTITAIAVKSTLEGVYITVAALVAAVVIGVLMKSFAHADLCMSVNNIFLERFNTMYMNALKTAVTPLVFFSIITCLAQFGSFSELGKTGGLIISLFLAMTFLSSSIGAGVFMIFRPGAEIHSFTASAGSVIPSSSFQQSDFITSIIPSNILLPFLNMNMIQVIFLAFALGWSMGVIGEAGKILRDFFDACNKMFMAFTRALIALIPFAAFCAILSAVLTSDAGSRNLLSLGGFCVATVAGLALVLCLDMAYVAVVGRVSPFTFIKKYFPVMLFSLTSSTTGCIPINLEYCEKLGIPRKICSFSVPLGSTVSLDGVAMYVSLASLTLAGIYGVNLSFTGILGVIASSVILSVSAPGIPGTGLICVAVLTAQIGVPAEAIGIIMGVDAVLTILRTPVNIFSIVSTSLVASSRMGVLDMEAFNSNAA